MKNYVHIDTHLLHSTNKGNDNQHNPYLCSYSCPFKARKQSEQGKKLKVIRHGIQSIITCSSNKNNHNFSNKNSNNNNVKKITLEIKI